MAAESENRCAKCQRTNPPGMRFCGFCGSPLAGAYQAGGGEQGAVSGEQTGNTGAKAVASPAPPAVDRTAELPMPPVAAPGVTLAGSQQRPSAPQTASPGRTPTPKPQPPIPSNLTPIQREVERDKLMTQAGVQRARGQVTDARETLERALLLAEGGPRRDIASIHEQIGDLLVIEEALERAAESYQKAIEIDSTRTTADKKYANTQIAISDREAEKRLGQTFLSEDMGDILKSGSGLSGHGGKRNAGMAMALSVIVPGFGQFYNGQFIKGAILLGTFALALLIISLSPDKEGLFGGLAATLALKPGKAHAVAPLIIGVAVIGFAAWLYSIVDAPAFAGKTSAPEGINPHSLKDKSGWEV